MKHPPCVPCLPNTFNDNPEVGKEYKYWNNSRPWTQCKVGDSGDGGVRKVIGTRTRNDYIKQSGVEQPGSSQGS